MSRAAQKKRDPAEGLLAGFVSGLAAGAVMSLFSAAWGRVSPATRGEPLRSLDPEWSGRKPRLLLVKGSNVLAASQQEWDSTERAAAAIGRAALHRDPSPKQRVRGAIAVHFAVSAAAGALYGAAAEFAPQVSAGIGALFGIAMWAVAQELAMPALGWSRPLKDYSAGMQANSLGEHMVFGITTELLRRAVREAL